MKAGVAHAVPGSGGRSQTFRRPSEISLPHHSFLYKEYHELDAEWYLFACRMVFPVVRGEYIPTEPGARGFRMNDFFEKPYGGSAVGGGGVRVGRQCVAAAVRQEAAAPAPGVGVAPCAFPFRTTCAFSGTETSGSRFVVLIFWLLLLVGQVNAFTSC